MASPDTSHKLAPTQIDGRYHKRCTVCGAIAIELLDKPCPGPWPELNVIADEHIVSIQFEFPEGGIKSSSFPQPLVTVDHALDGRPIAITFAGARARELRRALNESS